MIILVGNNLVLSVLQPPPLTALKQNCEKGMNILSKKFNRGQLKLDINSSSEKILNLKGPRKRYCLI